MILTSPFANVTAINTQSNESLTSNGNLEYFCSLFNSGVSGFKSSGTKLKL